MRETGTTQSRLSRLSGVRQPSIRGFLSGRVDMSDEMLDRLKVGVRGGPHTRNVERWSTRVRNGDVPGLRRVMSRLDTDSIEMREVSPMGDLLPWVSVQRLSGWLADAPTPTRRQFGSPT